MDKYIIIQEYPVGTWKFSSDNFCSYITVKTEGTHTSRAVYHNSSEIIEIENGVLKILRNAEELAKSWGCVHVYDFVVESSNTIKILCDEVIPNDNTPTMTHLSCILWTDDEDGTPFDILQVTFKL